MVVAMERINSGEKMKKYIGNKLILNFPKNDSTLMVTGNNCKIRLDENSGSIKVVGSDCEITVLKGIGSIEYVGNCGKIYLGASVPENSVTYIGNDGKISPVRDANNTNGTATSQGTKLNNLFSGSVNGNGNVNVVNSNMVRISTCCKPETVCSSTATRVNKKGPCR